MKFVTVVGARPQFVKAAMLSRRLRERHTEVLVHTGQHYDDLMSDIFFRELGLATPDINLGVGSASHAVQTARALERLEEVLLAEDPDCVIVFGDTNSTLAGALAAAKLDLPVAHVEAGLRSYDGIPEEINRVVTDHVSRYLFCPTATAVACLAREGIESGVFEVGDLMFDALLAILPRVEAEAASVLEKLDVERGAYFLATVHRQENTDDPERLGAIFEALGSLPGPVIVPLHPRTQKALAVANIRPWENVRLLDPVGYVDMIALEHNARTILTDSGGVSREAYFLGVPCVTLREDFEWPETLDGGWNVLAGADSEAIVAAAVRVRPTAPAGRGFGDGGAASKIIEALESDPPHGRG
jgi:UDP-GlcNAc3NAcA epimerase